MNRPATFYPIAPLPVDSGNDEVVDLRGVYRILRFRYRVVAVSVIVGTALALAYLCLATPLYTATTQLYIDTREMKTIDLGADVPGVGSDTTAIDSEVEILKSTSVAKRVISALHLQNDPEFGAAGVRRSFLTTITRFLGFSNRGAAQPANTAADEDAALNKQAELMAKRLDVKRIGLTYVISVSYTSPDAEMAAKVANQVADAYLTHQLDAKFEMTKRASDSLRDHLQELRARVSESEKAVELYRAQQNLVGVERETPYDAQLKKLNEELALARVEVDARFAKFQQAREIIKTGGKLTSIDAVAQSDVVAKLRDALANVSREEAELATRYTERHPKVLNKRAERHGLERRIAEEAKRIVLNLENEYQIAGLRRASIEKSLQQLKEETKGARSALIRLKELELEAEANEAVYKAFLNRFKETTQQETLGTADAQIITRAIAPESRSSPKTLPTVILALIGSLTVGVGLVFLLEHLDNRFKTGKQIEEKLKIAHLGSLPKLLPVELVGQSGAVPIERYIAAQPISAYAEAIRTLKVGLQLSNVDKPLKALMITSSQPNEGKTTVAANLAQYTARSGLRTLLIDADLRNPSLSARLAQRSGQGMVDVLARKQSIEQAILHDDCGADFLPSAQIPSRAAEILGSKGMEEILIWACKAYDLVLIDTAPVSHIVDTRVLAQLVDGILLVIEWDHTRRDAVEAAIKALRIQPDRIAGAVLNKVDLPRMASYKGDDYKRYSKSHPHYYGTYG